MNILLKYSDLSDDNSYVSGRYSPQSLSPLSILSGGYVSGRMLDMSDSLARIGHPTLLSSSSPDYLSWGVRGGRSTVKRELITSAGQMSINLIDLGYYG